MSLRLPGADFGGEPQSQGARAGFQVIGVKEKGRKGSGGKYAEHIRRLRSSMQEVRVACAYCSIFGEWSKSSRLWCRTSFTPLRREGQDVLDQVLMFFSDDGAAAALVLMACSRPVYTD